MSAGMLNIRKASWTGGFAKLQLRVLGGFAQLGFANTDVGRNRKNSYIYNKFFMKVKWIKISVISSLIAFVVSQIFTGEFLISTTIAILVFVIVALADPERRYMKVFWSSLSLLFMLNNVAYKFIGSIYGFDVMVASPDSQVVLSIIIGMIAFFALALDFIERNAKFDFIKNKFTFKNKSSRQNINNQGEVKNQINIENNDGEIRMK